MTDTENYLPDTPYKGLMPYSETDRLFFFGREGLEKIIIDNLKSERLTILYGASGVGKSSVLRAGVTYRLHQEAEENLNEYDFLGLAVVVFPPLEGDLSWYDEPLTGIKQQIETEIKKFLDVQPPKPRLPFVETLREWSHLIRGKYREGQLFIVLDQFEEYLLYHSQKEEKDPFALEFPRAVTCPDLNVNFLISIRKEALTELDYFKGRIPNLLENRLEIKHLDWNSGREAIEKPIYEYNRQQIIINELLDKRLTVLYGDSSAGKSTVLRAGIAFYLRQAAKQNLKKDNKPKLAVVVFNSWDEAPLKKLLQEIEKEIHSLGIVHSPSSRLSFVKTLEEWAKLVGDEEEGGELFIIFDQFEQYLWEYAQVEGEDTFAVELVRALDNPHLKVHFLISIHEQARPELEILFPNMAKWCHHYLHLFRDDVRSEPIKQELVNTSIALSMQEDVSEKIWSKKFDIEEELVKKVLNEVETKKSEEKDAGGGELVTQPEGQIETAYLQLVMTRLWQEDIGQGLNCLRLKTLKELGDARNIVSKHLTERMNFLSDSEQDAAAIFFQYLVTPGGTKIAYPVLELAERIAERTNLKENELKYLLEKLASPSQRLLRPLGSSPDHPDVRRYEIFHDVLAKPILKWRQEREEERRIQAKVQEEERRIQAEAEAKRQRFLKRALEVSIVAGLVFAVTAAVAVRSTLLSQKQEQIARANQLAIRAQLIRSQSPHLYETSALLAAESMKRFQQIKERSVEADGALRDSLELLPISISRIRHQDMVEGVAFSPDGQYLATASSDNTARISKVTTGKKIADIPHEDLVVAVTFSPDGKYLATASYDHTARISEVTTEKEIARISHQGSVEGVVFSPDGQYLATASSDNTARVTEVATGSEIARISHQDIVVAVAFSPDGRYLATASWDNTVRISEVTTEKEIARISHQGSVEGVVFSPDGKYLATASYDNTARISEVTTGREIARISHQDIVVAVAFSPDGKYLATASYDNTARISEVTTGKKIADISHQGSVEEVVFSPDGQYLATASWDKTARISEVTTGKEIARISHQDSVVAVVFNPDSKYLATASSDNTARVNEVVPTGREIARISHQDIVVAVTFSPDGQYLATGSRDKTALISGVTTGKEIARISHQDSVVAVTFSPDGQYLATASWDKTALISGVTTGKEIARISHQDSVVAVTFSPDGQYLATASWDKTARISEVTTGKEIARISHQDSVVAVVFNPDSKYLATASSDNTARVTEVLTGREIDRISHQGGVKGLAFSPDGQYLATTSGDNTIRISEVKTGKEIARISHQDRVLAVAFSPDGQYLATASGDNTALISEVKTGKEIARISHQDRVLAVAFSPDGKYLATTSSDKTAQLHLASPEALMAEACRRLKRNLTVDEWQNYTEVQLHRYDKTCKDYPIDSSFLKEQKD